MRERVYFFCGWVELGEQLLLLVVLLLSITPVDQVQHWLSEVTRVKVRQYKGNVPDGRECVAFHLIVVAENMDCVHKTLDGVVIETGAVHGQVRATFVNAAVDAEPCASE